MAKQSPMQTKDDFIADDEDFVEDAPQQSSSNWLLQNVAKPAVATPLDMVTGAVQGGIDLANLIPGVHMAPGLDLAQAAGVGGNRGDDLIKNLSSYIPTAAASELAAPLSATQGFGPLMAKLGTEGALYQTSQTPDEPGKVALSSALNMGIPASILGAGGGINKLAEFFAAPGMAKNIVSPMMDLKDLKNSDALMDAKANFDQHEKVEDGIWDSVTKNSEAYGNKPLDTSSYVTPILGEIKKLQADANKHSGFNNANSEAIKTLKKYLNQDDLNGLVPEDELESYGTDQYSNFPDALKQNVALNKDYKNTLRPVGGMPKTQEELKATNFARDQLHNMIADNLDKYGLTDTLGRDWGYARNLTRDINTTFKTVPDAKGNAKVSDFYANQMTTNPYADPTGFVSQYIPKKGEGVGTMAQFSSMIGNKDKATDYLKSNIFHDVMAGNKPDISKFVDITQKDLSPDQISYLFNPNQQEQIKLLSKINDKYPTEFPNAWKSLGTAAVAALAGFSAHPALAIGAASGPAAYNLAYRAASSPAISGRVQNAMLARMRGENPVMGQTPVNLSRSLIAANQSGGNQ